jgi:hypothetical protein
MKKNNLLLIIILLVAGAGFLFFGVHEFKNSLELKQHGLKTEGTVIDLKKHSSGKKATYMPEIEFITDTGQTVACVYQISSSRPTYSVGQRVKIIYSKDNPENFIIDSKMAFVFPVILILSGAVFVLIVIAVVIKKLKFVFHLA